MDRQSLYDRMAARKDKPADLLPYDGNNGRVNRCVELFRKGFLRTGGTLLDVGGAIGDLGYAVRDLFDRRIVVDIADLNRKAAVAKENEFLVCDVDKHGLLGVASDSVDVVVALDFIEHIIDPEAFARECYRVLKPSGEVFLNTPNIRHWRHIEQLWKQGTFPHTSGDREVFHGGHLAFFCRRDLCLIFEPNGFTSFDQIKDEEGYEQPPPFWLNTGNILGQRDYVKECLELGCPNLLFKAVVTK